MTNKEMQEKAKSIVKKLSIEQKAKLLTGEDFLACSWCFRFWIRAYTDVRWTSWAKKARRKS